MIFYIYLLFDIGLQLIKYFYCDTNAIIDHSLVSKERFQYYDRRSLFYKDDRYLEKDTHNPSKRLAEEEIVIPSLKEQAVVRFCFLFNLYYLRY